jgi:hypothetical protein
MSWQYVCCLTSSFAVPVSNYYAAFLPCITECVNACCVSNSNYWNHVTTLYCLHRSLLHSPQSTVFTSNKNKLNNSPPGMVPKKSACTHLQYSSDEEVAGWNWVRLWYQPVRGWNWVRLWYQPVCGWNWVRLWYQPVCNRTACSHGVTLLTVHQHTISQQRYIHCRSDRIQLFQIFAGHSGTSCVHCSTVQYGVTALTVMVCCCVHVAVRHTVTAVMRHTIGHCNETYDCPL